MSHFSPLSISPSDSLTALARSGPSNDHFLLEGEFRGFASGKKSPFKYLLVKTAAEEVRIKLKKSLRMMLFRYLVAGDWVKVVGRQKWESDELILKADEVIRIPMPTDVAMASPPPKEKQLEASNSAPPHSKKKTKAKAPKILICRKSGCRKRGGSAVGEMVERSLSELGLSDQVSVKYTGCMDRCKAGPNVVFMPGKAKYTRVEPGSVPDLVRQHCAEIDQN